MISKVSRIHPYVRLIFLLGGLTGAILCSSNLSLTCFWIMFLIPLIIIANNFKTHVRFILIVVLPMLVMLLFVHWVTVDDMHAGISSTIALLLKLIVYTTVIQLTLTIPSQDLLPTLKMWGMRKGALITSLGVYVVWVDVFRRSEKILTARFARGYIPERTFITKLKQLPHLLIPLIIGIMRTSTERAESWEQKNLLYRIENIELAKMQYSPILNIVLVVVPIVWAFINTYLVL